MEPVMPANRLFLGLILAVGVATGVALSEAA